MRSLAIRRASLAGLAALIPIGWAVMPGRTEPPRRAQQIARAMASVGAGGVAPALTAVPRLSAIAGHVRRGGAPVDGAEICARCVEDSCQGDEEPRCAASAQGGAYRIDGLTPGVHVVGGGGGAGGGGPARWRDARGHGGLRLIGGETRTGIDLELPGAGAALRGTVRDLYGGPVPGALVAWTGWSGGEPAPVVTRTDDEGGFELEVSPGQVALRISAAGFSPATRAAVAPSAGLDVVLAPEAEIRGRVVERASGAPVAGAVVVARGRPRDGVPGAEWVRATAITEADGSFDVGGLATGRYLLVVESGGWSGRSERAIEAAFAEPVDGVTIEVRRGVLVAGRVVTSQGTACEGARVALVAARAVVRASGDEHGEVRFAAVPPGSYEVAVECDGAPTLAAPDLEVGDRPRGDLVWRLERGLALSGRVTDGRGAPVGDARVAIEPELGEGPEGTSATAAVDVASDAEGRFVVTGLLPGRYSAVVYTEDRRPRGPAALVVLDLVTPPPELALVIVASAALTGQIEGVAAAGSEALGVVATPERGERTTASVDPDGGFRFAGLPPGRLELVVCDAWAGEVARVAGVEARIERTTAVRLVLPAYDRPIRGRVIDRAGEPVDDALVRARREPAVEDAPCAAAGGARAAVPTDERGRFELPALPAGDYHLGAVSLGGAEGDARATAAEVLVPLDRPRAEP